LSYSPQFITGEPQFRTPTPSERDRIKMFLFIAMFMFLIAGIILVIVAAYNFSEYSIHNAMTTEELRDTLGSEYRSATEAELKARVGLFAVYGGVAIGMGIPGFIMFFIVRMKALIPIDRGEYEEAGRYLNIFMILGFVFGLFLAGFFVYKAKALLKATATRVTPQSTAFDGTMYLGKGTGAAHMDIRRCPTCNTMMTFNEQMKHWYCSHCNKYQM
jgi:hypothetical protein